MLQKFFSYFKLSHGERKGFFVLFILVCLMLFLPFLYTWLSPTRLGDLKILTFEQTKTAVHERKESSFPTKTNRFTNSSSKNQLFPFDPNLLDRDGWIQLGFSPKQIEVIFNYKLKGGRFYKKEDLQKIYVISPADYDRIKDFVVLQPFDNKQAYSDKKFDAMTSQKENQQAVQETLSLIDINHADTTDFIKLKGIGSVFAKRIVKYRESLGGFVNENQIKEIYGLPIETFEAIQPFLKVTSASAIVQLHVNDLDAKSLAKHPYVKFKKANAIVNYRSQHGPFSGLEDLRKIHLLDDEFLNKIAPYLTF